MYRARIEITGKLYRSSICFDKYKKLNFYDIKSRVGVIDRVIDVICKNIFVSSNKEGWRLKVYVKRRLGFWVLTQVLSFEFGGVNVVPLEFKIVVVAMRRLFGNLGYFHTHTHTQVTQFFAPVSSLLQQVNL